MKYLFLLITLLTTISCQKGLLNTNSTAIIKCEALQQALLNNDAALVDSSLDNLLNMSYSEENLNRLADTISKNCDIKAVLVCFECIETLPAQSDMALTFMNNGDSVTKELDFIPGVNDKTIKLVEVQ